MSSPRSTGWPTTLIRQKMLFSSKHSARRCATILTMAMPEYIYGRELTAVEAAVKEFPSDIEMGDSLR